MPDMTADKNQASDGQLLAVIGARKKPPDQRRAAFSVLYKRHVTSVYKCALRFKGRLGGDEGVADTVHEAFIRAHDRAETFNADAADRAGGSARPWLCKIVTRLCLQRIQDDAKESAVLAERHNEDHRRHLAPVTSSVSLDDGRVPDWKEVACRAATSLARLSDRDRHVLVSSLDWYNKETKEFDVPADVIEELCEMHGVSHDNYRQIRYRSFKKVLADVQSDPAQVA